MLRSIFGNVATDSIPTGDKADTQRVDLPAATSGEPDVRVGGSVLTTAGDSLSQQPDTVQLSARQNAQIRKIIPRIATIRSLMLPGLGQIYNRQYYKLPFVYAGFTVLIYDIINFNKLYKLYEAGYAQAYNSTISATVPYKVAVVRGRELGVQQLKQASDAYHNYRDLNVILTVAFWGIQAVEANVAAHLKTFDLSDNLSLNWKPTLLLSPTTGVIPGIRLTFNFKK